MGFVFPIGLSLLGSWLPRDKYQQKYPRRSYWGLIVVQAILVGFVLGVLTIGATYLFDQQFVWLEGLFRGIGYVVGMLLGSILVAQRQPRA